MKRKLDDNDAPSTENKNEAEKLSFDSFSLEPRLLQAVYKLQYSEPTPIQASAIPLALEGKDILGQAKTGSGKTAAYLLPALHTTLQGKRTTPRTSTVILVPTRELADQVYQNVASFTAFCSKDITFVNLSRRQSDAVLQAALQEQPDIVIATPGRAQQFVAEGHLQLNDLQRLVIDEADLVLSYGYETDITAIATLIPRGIQTILMSATLTEEVETLQQLFCRTPVTLKLEEESQENNLTQYVVKCGEDEKFLLIFVIFKLKLVRGKTIIFVADVDRSYRLKLYLEQYGVRSCVLNSELPINSRLHVVQEFNKGVYDIIIAADDQEVIGGIPSGSEMASQEQSLKTTKRRKGNLDFGVSRGIDFQNVACVLNFDLPPSSKSYTHRIGRTARAGKTGMALSFVVPRERYGKHKPTTTLSAGNDEKILERIVERQAKIGKEVKPYHFDTRQLDAFRYRMNDALRAVTRVAVRDFRAREIRQELLKSEKLKKHFEENPEDLRHLRHDHQSQTVRTQPHLQHVPAYLMPAKGRKGATVDEVEFISMQKLGAKKSKAKKRLGGKGRNLRGRLDPLRSFQARNKR